MKPELSGIFWVEIVTKNIVLGSPETPFIHVRVNINQHVNSTHNQHIN